ncbi:Hybrid signal transduction histidine kinase J [Seminavis robusta]|uniref:Hybrid signal transduction histidine kinase J n=1 Tax=Seminavis robusta TaxID=568900 RepID=A0A9N8EMU7_9STRA|nr:Hybrid signal transduction histidine kinase J [Seminavis robusta]|eukprot:Sro1435_g272380.1 Hybrid signal transduction histidine kinase J (1110) ;mRNA; r:18491-21820
MVLRRSFTDTPSYNRQNSKEDLTGGGCSTAEEPEKRNSNSIISDKCENIAKAIAQPEDFTILILRGIVLLVLAISTALVAFTVFSVAQRSERERFEQSSLDSSTSLVEAVEQSLSTALGAVDTFVVGMVSFARYSQMQWPFVTLPDAPYQMAKLRRFSNVACLSQYNLISPDQVRQWQEYTKDNSAWVQEGLRSQGQQQGEDLPQHSLEESNNGTIPFGEKRVSGVLSRVLRNYNGRSESNSNDLEMTEQQHQLLSWQSSPVRSSGKTFNRDFSALYSNPTIWSETVQHGRVVFAELQSVPEEADANKSKPVTQCQGTASNVVSPMSDIIYPITSGAADPAHKDGASSPVIGVIVASISWQDVLSNVLPSKSGAIIVLSNDCGQTVSYQVDGPRATSLGHGDQHDPSYNHLKREVSLLDLASASTQHSGIPMSDKGCPLRMTVYPAKQFDKKFTTNQPIFYVLQVLSLFAFVTGLLYVYDACVERRQRLFTKKVWESSVNVSLLEKLVEERTETLRETNTRLELANRKLAATSKAQLETFACMSHEIRTPLNCIIGLATLLQDTDLSPQQEESMSMIVSSSDLLLAVVNDILTFSKLEAGKMEVETKRSSLQEVLNSVVFAMETKAEEREINLHTEFGAHVSPSLRTDPRRLQQVLYNLLGNAIKFADTGSRVDFRLEIGDPVQGCEDGTTDFYSPTDDKPSELAANQLAEGSNVLRFSIKNIGAGISKPDMKAIFEPFRQSPVGLKHGGGTGLGLAITSKLVHALGGRISVESKAGSWAKFSVEFPNRMMAPLKARRLSQKLKSSTVGLVCNQAETVDRMKDLMKAYGVKCVSFASLDELQHYVQEAGDEVTKQHLLCLLDEEFYDEIQCRRILLQKKLWFEISFTVVGAKHNLSDEFAHIRSLDRTLPAVLVEHLAAQFLPFGVGLKRNSTCDSCGGSSRRVAEESARMTPTYEDYRVLIAEDNLINQKVMVRMLNRIGIHNIEIADNGQKAVEMEASKKFDVVLLDMQMPVMDGIEACHLIRDSHSENYRGGAPKIYFVTAHIADDFPGLCRNAGAAGMLSKPFKLKDVESCFTAIYESIQAEVLGHEEHHDGCLSLFRSNRALTT